MIGAEPTTSPLPRVCSTTELHGRTRTVVSLNLERETGLEPATLCLEGRYSSQLSYSRNIKLLRLHTVIFRVEKDGGQGRIRTFVDRSQQIYSLPPLATRAPVQTMHNRKNLELVMGLEPATC